MTNIFIIPGLPASQVASLIPQDRPTFILKRLFQVVLLFFLSPCSQKIVTFFFYPH